MSRQKLDFFTLDLKDIQEQDLVSADKNLQDALALALSPQNLGGNSADNGETGHGVGDQHAIVLVTMK